MKACNDRLKTLPPNRLQDERSSLPARPSRAAPLPRLASHGSQATSCRAAEVLSFEYDSIVALEKLSGLLESTQRWFEGQGKSYAAIDANQRVEAVTRAVREDSGEIEAYGGVSGASLTDLVRGALTGSIPNPDWLALCKLVGLAIQKKSESLLRLRPPTSFPENVRQHADLRFQGIAAETRKRIETERAEIRRRVGPRDGPSHIFELLEDRKKLSGELVRARLETLVVALRRLGHSVRPYHELISKEVSDVARAGAAGTQDEIGRMSTAVGGLPNVTALQSDASLAATEHIADAARRLKIEELEEEHAPAPRAERSWRDLEPAEDCDFEVLAVKRAFDRDLLAAASESSPAAPLSMLFIDLDDLKQLNKRFTNPVVNKGLAALALALMNVAKGRGKAYRYGGDEFALLLPNVTKDEAARTGERIRAAVAALTIPGEPEMHLTVSVGVACLEEVQGRDPEILQKAAAEASSAAKDLGKNRVETFPLSISPPQSG